MSVNIPKTDPAPGGPGYDRVMQPLHAATPQGIAMKCNYLHGQHNLRLRNLIIRPFRTVAGQEYSTDSIYIPFRTSSLVRGLFVAVAVVNVHRGEEPLGAIKVSVREAPTFVADLATPGSGALVDPGCQWLQASGSLPEPVRDGRWTVPTMGPVWVHTGRLRPPVIDLMGSATPVPRTLKVNPGADHELLVEWVNVAPVTVTLLELYEESK